MVEEEIRRGDGDPDAALVERLGVSDPEEFWSPVDDNLRLGRLRLLFVADRIPAELVRVVEFLNEQMDRTEVLAVEVRQFAGESHKTLVPRALGRTCAAAGTNGPGALCTPCRRSTPHAADRHPMPEIDRWHNGGLMALDRVLLHVRRGSRLVKRAVDPADVYLLEADGGGELVRRLSLRPGG